MSGWLRRIWCALGQHSGYVDGGFHCAYCPFSIPYKHDDALIDRLISARRLEKPDAQAGIPPAA